MHPISVGDAGGGGTVAQNDDQGHLHGNMPTRSLSTPVERHIRRKLVRGVRLAHQDQPGRRHPRGFVASGHHARPKSGGNLCGLLSTSTGMHERLPRRLGAVRFHGGAAVAGVQGVHARRLEGKGAIRREWRDR